jgi:hypothetical protein
MFDALGPYRWSVGNGIERLKQLLDEPTDEDILASHMSGYEDISDGPTENDSRRARSGSSSSGADSKHNEDNDDTFFSSIEELLADRPMNESGRSKGIYYTISFHILYVRRNF